MDKKQIGQVVVLGSALVLNLAATNYAVAATACSDAVGSSIVSSATGFVKQDFLAKCSKNVNVVYAESNTDFAVKSGSIKGMHTFGGSTIGGAVGACEQTSVSNPAGAISGGANLSSPASGTPAGC